VAVPLDATEPREGEIDTKVALDVDQDNVDGWPAVMLDGLAENDEINGGGGGTGVTVTVVWAVTLPAPVAVSVYVVFVDGETALLPLSATAPTDGAILTELAFEVDHDNVDCWPAAMLDGLAVNDEITGGGGGTGGMVTVIWDVTLPVLLVAVSVYVVVAAGETAASPLVATAPTDGDIDADVA
jgi:hypothetical protein